MVSSYSRRDITDEDKADLIENLTFEHNGHEVRLADLGLTFEYSPSSQVYGFPSTELIPNGDTEEVRMFENQVLEKST